MKIFRCMLFVILTFFALEAAGGANDWQKDIDSLIQASPGPKQETLLAKIVAAQPSWQEVVAHIQALPFPEVEKGKALLRTTVCSDSVELPWVLYVPSGYSPKLATPLQVILHGGVSRAKIIDDPKGYAEQNPFTALAEKHGWLVLFPFGQAGATWWDEVGMENIRNLVRTVKRECNVDDDRVWMGGFSDGGSASFLHAMVDPTDYAAFVALNGHMGVGSLDGNLPTYAPNFFNTHIYAITTDRDELYPSHKMRVLIDMARHAGGKILYRQHEGSHELSYGSEELPLIASFLERHPRDPFPTRIIYETADRQFGLCRWFAIDRVTTDEPARWHIDYNAALVDDRVTIGFFPDDSYKGSGVKLGRIVEGDTPARRLGLQPGDVIVRAGTKPINTLEDLSAFKAGVQRGDAIELTVKRGEEELVLKGKIPEPENYYVFKREQPSAMVRVSFSANRVDIEASRVGAFRILVHPDLIRLEQNLVVRVNWRVVYDARVKPDIDYLLRNFIENRDRRLLYIAEVKIEL